MSIVRRTIALSDAGNKPGAIGAIPTNFSKYNEYLYGIRQHLLINVLAETAVGKTSWGRHTYLHTPYEYFLKINNPEKLDVEFLDFSLEIADTQNLASAISRKAYLEYGKVIPIAELFGWGDNKLTPENRKIRDSLVPYFDAFEKKCTVVDGEVSPQLFHDVCFEASKRYGKWTREGINIANSYGWVPTNPNLYVIGLIDTVNLAEGDAVKQTMDKLSRYAVVFRNKCGFTFILLQQISAEIQSTERGKFGITTPILRDAEDSRRPGKDKLQELYKS